MCLERTTQTHIFSCTWKTSCTVLRLATAPLKLTNASFFVTFDDLVVEELLIGFPFLRCLDIQTKSLLKERRNLLDGFDCLPVFAQYRSHGAKASPLLNSHLNRLPSSGLTTVRSVNESRLHVDRKKAFDKNGSSSDSSVLDLDDMSMSNEVKTVL